MKRLLICLLLCLAGCEKGGTVIFPIVTQADTEKARLEYNKGQEFKNNKDFKTAESCFTEAIRLKADYSEAYSQRGYVYLQLGDYDQAIVDYTEAIRINPDYAYGYLNRGSSWSGKKEYDKAMEDKKRARSIKKDTASGATVEDEDDSKKTQSILKRRRHCLDTALPLHLAHHHALPLRTRSELLVAERRAARLALLRAAPLAPPSLEHLHRRVAHGEHQLPGAHRGLQHARLDRAPLRGGIVRRAAAMRAQLEALPLWRWRLLDTLQLREGGPSPPARLLACLVLCHAWCHAWYLVRHSRCRMRRHRYACRCCD